MRLLCAQPFDENGVEGTKTLRRIGCERKAFRALKSIEGDDYLTSINW